MVQEFYLPTFDECLEIVGVNEAFDHKMTNINGINVHYFNYRLATYDDFLTPIPGKNISAFELRGLTFLEDNGEIIKVYRHLHKFFNINQVKKTQYDAIKDTPITNIYEKVDGSMITFINIKGEFIPKTKKSFDFPGLIGVRELMDKSLINFLSKCEALNLVPIFEYTSPSNRIVLNYKESSLTLLQLRDNISGKYFDIHKNELVKEHNIKTPKKFIKTLDELLQDKSTKEDIEGYIVCFEDGTFIKIKTDWYLKLHNIATNDIYDIPNIITLILDEEIDDIMAELLDSIEAKRYLESLIVKVNRIVNHYINESEKLLDIFITYDSKKDFAMAYKNNIYFSIVMKHINASIPISDAVINRVKFETRKLELAKRFLKYWDEIFNQQYIYIEDYK
jgi:RNA ligase